MARRLIRLRTVVAEARFLKGVLVHQTLASQSEALVGYEQSLAAEARRVGVMDTNPFYSVDIGSSS